MSGVMRLCFLADLRQSGCFLLVPWTRETLHGCLGANRVWVGEPIPPTVSAVALLHRWRMARSTPGYPAQTLPRPAALSPSTCCPRRRGPQRDRRFPQWRQHGGGDSVEKQGRCPILLLPLQLQVGRLQPLLHQTRSPLQATVEGLRWRRPLCASTHSHPGPGPHSLVIQGRCPTCSASAEEHSTRPRPPLPLLGQTGHD
mmetsp:Transcript_825/g.2657  ORF Transcript_825/g.2657 Transcript_825/m.2657 type:complete len:200 (+) Transcript_825:399-998(+)